MTGTEIYNLICYDLLEDHGLSLGTLTDKQFLDHLNATVIDFLKETRLIKYIYTQQVVEGISRYTVPEDIMDVDDAFVAGILIGRETVASLNANQRTWRSKPDQPRFWHEDQLPLKTIELAPSPNYTGMAITSDGYGDFSAEVSGPLTVSAAVHRGLTIVGPAKPELMRAIAEDIPLIPDDFCRAYLAFGVEERIFSADSELKDLQAALFCKAVYQEGISMCKSIFSQVEEDIR